MVKLVLPSFGFESDSKERKWRKCILIVLLRSFCFKRHGREKWDSKMKSQLKEFFVKWEK